MITTIPPAGILVDLPFGVLMWTSFAHFLLIMVMREDSAFIVLRVLRGVNYPIHQVIDLIKPSFIITRLVPLYCALVLFILRYYLLPMLIGFDVWDFFDMPLERLLLSAKADPPSRSVKITVIDVSVIGFTVEMKFIFLPLWTLWVFVPPESSLGTIIAL